jgi:hypothetical protein
MQGLGYDTLCSLLQGFPLTHVVLLQTATTRRNLEPRAFWRDGGAEDRAPDDVLATPAILQIPAVGQAVSATADQPASPPMSPPEGVPITPHPRHLTGRDVDFGSREAGDPP